MEPGAPSGGAGFPNPAPDRVFPELPDAHGETRPPRAARAAVREDDAPFHLTGRVERRPVGSVPPAAGTAITRADPDARDRFGSAYADTRQSCCWPDDVSCGAEEEEALSSIKMAEGVAAAPHVDGAGTRPSGEQGAAFEREMGAGDDPALAVSMKQAGRGEGLPGGVSHVNMAVANKVQQRHGDLGSPKATNHQIAEKRANGWYGIPGGGSADDARPLHGTFTPTPPCSTARSGSGRRETGATPMPR